MKSADHSNEFVGAAELGHDSPEALAIYCVKGLSQVHKCGVQVNILFPTLFLELSGSKNHVHSSSALSEATLALWEKARFEVTLQSV